jgi:branched-chain amino acid transport system substrate-binding protein
VRSVGLTQPIAAIGSVYSPKFIELGGKDVDGVYTESVFFPGDSRPEVKAFVDTYKARYGEEPDEFSADAYDTFILLAAVMNRFGTTRQDIHDGLGKIKDVPSVIFGKASFDTQTRRVTGGTAVDLVVKDGKFQQWDGKKPT